MTTIAVGAPGPRLELPSRDTVAQLGRYVAVGALGTALSALFYLVFRTWWDALPANLAAIALSTVASTEANRRFTFRGARARRSRSYVQNAGTVAFYAAYSSLVLAVLGVVAPDASALQESVAVAATSVLGGLGRYVVLRNWVFGAAATA